MSKPADPLKAVFPIQAEDQSYLEDEARLRLKNLIENPVSSELEMHIQKGFECHLLCTKALIRCLQNKTDPDYFGKLMILQSCADITEINSDILLSEKQVNKKINQLCAKIAETCARSCSHSSDRLIAQCAFICKEYAQSCRMMG